VHSQKVGLVVYLIPTKNQLAYKISLELIEIHDRRVLLDRIKDINPILAHSGDEGASCTIPRSISGALFASGIGKLPCHSGWFFKQRKVDQVKF